MKALVSIIALAILSLTAVSCAQPVAPTATAYPTYTPPPTYTPYPTLADLPTHTPYPTPEPLPTHTPYPTPTALPTHTPYPTPTALPTYTPYPTATPPPTNTPIPTPTLEPTPTRLPERVAYRTYTSWLHQFEVSIPSDWDDTYDDDQYSFGPDNSSARALVQVVEKNRLPFSTYVLVWISTGKERGLEVLESHAVGSNQWYVRGRLELRSCVVEMEQNLFLKSNKIYIVITSACYPSDLVKMREPFDRFHASFRLY